jgi:hypothetical protein
MNDGVVGVRGRVKLTGLRLDGVDFSSSDDAQEAVTNLNNSAKSKPPISKPTKGIIMSVTREDTIFPKAPPIMTAIAKSNTLPLMANSLNSCHKKHHSFII